MSTVLKSYKTIRQKHPYIEKVKGICGGKAKIISTRFPVSSVVGYILRLGITAEEFVKEFKYITLAQVYDALSYYYDNKKEIDEEIERNTNIDYWKTKMGEIFVENKTVS